MPETNLRPWSAADVVAYIEHVAEEERWVEGPEQDGCVPLDDYGREVLRTMAAVLRGCAL